ncbi:MAG: type II toxin-antitoxin system RelE/ParE family toxin [Erysipelotrichaceae bacterium]|nr:type II toxin-antitoxin system RelE/ParE family toxin [Erysipelotrichaceae bacterium]
MAELKILITQRAFSDICEHILFVRNVSLEAAKELYEETTASLRSLSSFPERNPEIQDLRIAGARIRKMSIHNGHYVALYKVDGDTVVVYDAVDSRKDNSILKL